MVEVIQKISRKLALEKENLDKNKTKVENEKIEIARIKLENEITRGKLKILSSHLIDERKYIEIEKTEIEKFLKQINNFRSLIPKP